MPSVQPLHSTEQQNGQPKPCEICFCEEEDLVSNRLIAFVLFRNQFSFNLTEYEDARMRSLILRTVHQILHWDDHREQVLHRLYPVPRLQLQCSPERRIRSVNARRPVPAEVPTAYHERVHAEQSTDQVVQWSQLLKCYQSRADGQSTSDPLQLRLSTVHPLLSDRSRSDLLPDFYKFRWWKAKES